MRSLRRGLFVGAVLSFAASTLVPALAVPAPDTSAPTVEIAAPRTPPVRQRFLENLHGTVADDQSGVERVVVTYSPRTGLGNEQWTATVYDCDDSRRACSWLAGMPGIPGQYRITVVATDRAGNSSATTIDEAIIA